MADETDLINQLRPGIDGLVILAGGRRATFLPTVWESLPEHFPGSHFEIDDIFATEDRCTCRYTMSFDAPDGSRVSARGVDVFRIRDGLIAEKLTYMSL